MILNHKNRIAEVYFNLKSYVIGPDYFESLLRYMQKNKDVYSPVKNSKSMFFRKELLENYFIDNKIVDAYVFYTDESKSISTYVIKDYDTLYCREGYIKDIQKSYINDNLKLLDEL